MKFKLECEIDVDLTVYEDYIRACQVNDEKILVLSELIKEELSDSTLFVSVSTVSLMEIY